MTETPNILDIARRELNKVPGLTMPEQITAHDRCDVKECGAQAYVRLTYTTGTLHFCGHHYASIYPKGPNGATHIHDERFKLDGKRLDVSS